MLGIRLERDLPVQRHDRPSATTIVATVGTALGAAIVVLVLQVAEASRAATVVGGAVVFPQRACPNHPRIRIG